MPNQQPKDSLIAQLADLLSGEIRLSDAVIDYIDSTLGPASGNQLAKRLMDADDCESSAAIELIFFSRMKHCRKKLSQYWREQI